MASHYKIVAENELRDDPNASIYWYGYSDNMYLAHPWSGYTTGIVKDVIEKARIAEESRDVNIFCIDQHQGCNSLGILSKNPKIPVGCNNNNNNYNDDNNNANANDNDDNLSFSDGTENHHNKKETK